MFPQVWEIRLCTYLPFHFYMKMNDLLGTYDQQVFISGAIYDQKHNSAVKGALVQIKRAIRA
ncbi:MAG: hypothetical protein B6D39_12740 [Anaerolineae bacterium UTCFX2]|nr:MAG: hypothetical protein B6D39_12740 [Anaerolineae bacterium UTCFX2]